MAGIDDLERIDMRVGRIVGVAPFPEAHQPAYKLDIDFGPDVGLLRSSAQLTHYRVDALQGRLVVAVVNLPPRQIGPVRSEALVLGALDAEHGVVLLAPDRPVAPGDRIG